MYTGETAFGNDKKHLLNNNRKLPESTPSRETLAQVLQRGSLQDQLLDLHGHREGYVRVKVSTWGSISSSKGINNNDHHTHP